MNHQAEYIELSDELYERLEAIINEPLFEGCERTDVHEFFSVMNVVENIRECIVECDEEIESVKRRLEIFTDLFENYDSYNNIIMSRQELFEEIETAKHHLSMNEEIKQYELLILPKRLSEPPNLHKNMYRLN